MIPYGLRTYFRPGDEAGKFDESAYTPELHEQNLGALQEALSVHGKEKSKTPWLTSGIGVVAVCNAGEKFDFSSVYLADDCMSYRQGLHFVRQDITVHEKKGLQARTRVYPTFGRMVQLFTSSDAAWSMMYPTLNHHPKRASEHLQKWLSSPYDLALANRKNIEAIFPQRQLALRHWVGVKPPRN